MLSSWCDRIIRWGFILLFALVPLLLTPWNYELFEYNKMMGVYALTIIITGAWLVKSLRQGEFRITKTPLDIPLALFLSSQLISSFFSMDPHVSWFGYYSRFNGGMWSIICYILLYYAFVSNVQNLQKVLKVAIASGVVVALYGVAERLGIDKHLWVQDVQNRVFSTLGQPNWLAAFLAALSPIAWVFVLQTQNSKLKIQNFIWFGISFLFFMVLLFTRSRSGLVGFAVADVVFWGLVFVHFIRHRLASQDDVLRAWRGFIAVHLAFAIIIFFNGTSIPSIDRWMTLKGWRTNEVTNPRINVATASGQYTAPLLESGGTESGTIRKYVWQGAINAWNSSWKTRFIGTGTETFAFAFYQFKPKQHNLTSEWDFLYNKAHNEYLNYLATTGIFGLGSYLLLIGSSVWLFIQKRKNVLNNALFAGVVSILVTNFFGFSVVIMQLFLFLFPAIAFVLYSTGGQQLAYRSLVISGLTRNPVFKKDGSRLGGRDDTTMLLRRFFGLLILLVSFALLLLLVITWHADTLFASGYRLSRAGQYGAGAAFLKRAVRLNPIEPYYSDELGGAYAGMVTDATDGKDATTAATLVRLSLESSDRAVSTSPKNVNFWKTRTKIYYAFTSIDPAFTDAAITALEKARELSPTDPKIIYNLAILEGHKGVNEKAIELLRQAIDLKPNYRDSYYALWVFYTEVKKPDLARKVLEEYIAKVDSGDKDFLERLNQ